MLTIELHLFGFIGEQHLNEICCLHLHLVFVAAAAAAAAATLLSGKKPLQ